MKRFIKSFSIVFLLIALILFYFSIISKASSNVDIQPYSTQYIVYQYMDGNTYNTPTFKKTNSTTFTVNGIVSGSNVKVSLINATTGKQVGETKTMQAGTVDICSWSMDSIPNGQKFYYKFQKTNIFAISVFLNLYVLF